MHTDHNTTARQTRHNWRVWGRGGKTSSWNQWPSLRFPKPPWGRSLFRCSERVQQPGSTLTCCLAILPPYCPGRNQPRGLTHHGRLRGSGWAVRVCPAGIPWEFRVSSQHCLLWKPSRTHFLHGFVPVGALGGGGMDRAGFPTVTGFFPVRSVTQPEVWLPVWSLPIHRNQALPCEFSDALTADSLPLRLHQVSCVSSRMHGEALPADSLPRCLHQVSRASSRKCEEL